MQPDRWKQIVSSFPTVIGSSVSQNVLEQSSPPQSAAEQQAKLQELEDLLKEKCQIILEQKRTISELEAKLSAHPLPLQLPKNTQPNFIKLNQGLVRSRGGTDKIDQIMKSIESLESRMSTLISSLPKRIKHFCDQYLARCKLVQEPQGFYCIAGDMKDEIETLGLGCRAEFGSLNKNRISMKSGGRTTMEEQVERLERIVQELKLNFVEILLNRNGGGDGQVGKILKL